MFEPGKRVTVVDDQGVIHKGEIEVASEDDQGYHVRLTTGSAIEVHESKVAPLFIAGQRVRIKADAFPGSTESCDVRARGQVGVLLYPLDGAGLWQWRGDDGTVTAPIESELEGE